MRNGGDDPMRRGGAMRRGDNGEVGGRDPRPPGRLAKRASPHVREPLARFGITPDNPGLHRRGDLALDEARFAQISLPRSRLPDGHFEAGWRRRLFPLRNSKRRLSLAGL